MTKQNLPIRVLLVEDDEDDFFLIREAFARIAEHTFDLSRVADFDSALRAISSTSYDVCLLDYRLGERNGLELLEFFPHRCKIPIVFITGRGDYELDLGAMRAEVADYLVKDLRRLAEKSLKAAYGDLEKRVEERTAELVRVNAELGRKIDECTHTEKALRAKEEKVQSILHAAPTGIGVAISRIIHEANDQLCAMTGYSREELLHKDASLLYPTREEYDWVGREKYRQISEKGGGTVETRWRRKDGSEINVLLSSVPLYPDDLSLGVTFTALDITERKEGEKALRKQNEYLAALHEMSLGVASRLELDELLESIITHASALVGTPHAFIYTYDPQQHDLVIRAGVGWYKKHIGYRIAPGVGMGGVVWQTGEPFIVDDYSGWELRSPDHIWNEYGAVMGIPLKSDATVWGVIGLAYIQDARKFGTEELDIVQRFAALASIAFDNAQLYRTLQDELRERRRAEEERKRLESQLIQAQKLEAIGTLASGIAHDFNNLLLPILGYTEMALGYACVSDSLRYDLEQVLGAASRAKDLVRQILAFSHGGKEQPMILMDMSTVVKEALKLLKASLPSTIEIKQHIEKGVAEIDATQIHQVIVNLCTNAAHAMDGRGMLNASLSKEYLQNS